MENHHQIVNDPRKLLEIALKNPAMPTRDEVLKLRSKFHALEVRECLKPNMNARDIDNPGSSLDEDRAAV